MKDNETEEMKDEVIYKHTDYSKKLLVNGIMVSALIVLSCVIIFAFALPAVFSMIVKPTVENLYRDSLSEAVSPYKEFLIDSVSAGDLEGPVLVKARELISKRNEGNLNEFYTSLETMFNLVALFAMLVIGTLISFYMRSNADVFIMGLGTLQKKLLIAGLKENLRIEEKEAKARAINEKAKDELRESQRKWRHEHEKEKAQLRLDKIRDKSAARKVS